MTGRGSADNAPDLMAALQDSFSRELGIRERTGSDQPDRPRYIVCFPVRGTDLAVFGQVQGGETREEAVFWAERLASKNDLSFQRPDGWDDVKGALPDAE